MATTIAANTARALRESLPPARPLPRRFRVPQSRCDRGNETCPRFAAVIVVAALRSERGSPRSRGLEATTSARHPRPPTLRDMRYAPRHELGLELVGVALVMAWAPL